jgi:Vacuolar membrane protease, transmembrane domain
MLSLGAVAVTVVEYFDVQRSGTQRLANADAVDDGVGGEQRENDQTETSPLLQGRRDDTNVRGAQNERKPAFWLLQYLVLVPYPVILVTQIGMLVLGGLPQTLADGGLALLGRPLHRPRSTY